MRRGAIFWIAGILVIGLAGFAAGWVVKGPGAPDFPFDTKAPGYQGADLPGGRSKAGFTGFGEEGGLSGATIIAGRVSEVSADSVTLATAAGASTIRITGEEKLRVLEPYAGTIAAGTTVFIRMKSGTDEAEAVLVLLDP